MHMPLTRRAALTIAMAGAARAQPARPAPPARLLIPYGAGNITDQAARVLLDVLGALHGWRAVADNQPGAGGMLGANTLIRAPADGSVVGIVASAALTILPNTQRQPAFDPLPGLLPLGGVSISNSCLAVHASLPVRSLAELAAHARARPADSPLFYYSPGNGTVPHLNLEALRRHLDMPLQHVPYRTSAAGNTDLLAGRVQVTMDSLSLTLPHIRSGALRPLAFNGAARHPALPAVPLVSELEPGLRLVNSWQGLFLPRGAPAAVAARLGEELRDAVLAPAFAEKLPAGTTPLPLRPDAVLARAAEERARIGRLIAEIGLETD